jgi:hypothetical protein
LFDDEQRDYTSDTVKPHRPAVDKPVSAGVGCLVRRVALASLARRSSLC